MWVAESTGGSAAPNGNIAVISHLIRKMSPGSLPTPTPTQTFTQPYSTYPQAYSQYSTQSYPSVNYASQAQGAVYPGFQVPYGRKDSTSWIDALSPQELSGVNPETASRVMHRFISAELMHEGFDAAEPATLDRLEVEVVHCGLLVLWPLELSCSYIR